MYTIDEIARIDYCRFEHVCATCKWKDSCSSEFKETGKNTGVISHN